MADPVTLILGEDRIEVSRQDLTSKSGYFASLFSPNFKDFQSSEHRINYDIDISTLQTFVNWVSDHSATGDRRRVKPTLEKFSGDFDGLLHLLQLSVLFAADNLVEDLTDLVVRHWLIPQKCIEMWLFARELGLTKLRDLAKAECVVRLEYLPESLLLELPGEDFIELVGKARFDYMYTFPCELVEQWVTHNVPPGKSNPFESRYPFTLLQYSDRDFRPVQKMYKGQYWNHNIQCIVGHKETHNQDDKARKSIYGWDGTNFSEILDLSLCPVCVNDIVGFQVVGRGFDIWLVGGKYAGSRTFQREIWRYSTITKTWYYVTRMPHSRRHMAVAFFESKLVLAGGRGKRQGHLRSTDVYDLDTGKWNLEAQESKVFFTNKSLVSPCILRALILYNIRGINLHTYDPNTDEWSVVDDNAPDDDSDVEDEMQQAEYGEGLGYYRNDEDDTSCFYPKFIMYEDGCHYMLGKWEDSDVLRVIQFEVEEGLNYRTYSCGKCSLESFDNQVANGPNLVGFALSKEGPLSILSIESFKVNSGKSNIVYEENRPDIHDLCREDPIGCFNIYDPKSLNDVYVLEKEATDNKAKGDCSETSSEDSSE